MKLFKKTKGSLLAIEGNEVLLYNSTREGATSDVRMHSSEAKPRGSNTGDTLLWNMCER